jgi:transcriptional regulator with XRE-family HTH domain
VARAADPDRGGSAGRPRAPHFGLWREEVAGLAGVSLDYLARLEQGRAQSPSPSVLASLARALRLSNDERAHLFRLAGHVEPGPGTINRHITPSLQRLLDRLADVPVMVIDASARFRGVTSAGSHLGWSARPRSTPRQRKQWQQTSTTRSGASQTTST